MSIQVNCVKKYECFEGLLRNFDVIQGVFRSGYALLISLENILTCCFQNLAQI